MYVAAKRQPVSKREKRKLQTGPSGVFQLKRSRLAAHHRRNNLGQENRAFVPPANSFFDAHSTATSATTASRPLSHAQQADPFGFETTKSSPTLFPSTAAGRPGTTTTVGGNGLFTSKPSFNAASQQISARARQSQQRRSSNMRQAPCFTTKADTTVGRTKRRHKEISEPVEDFHFFDNDCMPPALKVRQCRPSAESLACAAAAPPNRRKRRPSSWIADESTLLPSNKIRITGSAQSRGPFQGPPAPNITCTDMIVHPQFGTTPSRPEYQLCKVPGLPSTYPIPMESHHFPREGDYDPRQRRLLCDAEPLPLDAFLAQHAAYRPTPRNSTRTQGRSYPHNGQTQKFRQHDDISVWGVRKSNDTNNRFYDGLPEGATPYIRPVAIPYNNFFAPEILSEQAASSAGGFTPEASPDNSPDHSHAAQSHGTLQSRSSTHTNDAKFDIFNCD